MGTCDPAYLCVCQANGHSLEGTPPSVVGRADHTHPELEKSRPHPGSAVTQPRTPTWFWGVAGVASCGPSTVVCTACCDFGVAQGSPRFPAASAVDLHMPRGVQPNCFLRGTPAKYQALCCALPSLSVYKQSPRPGGEVCLICVSAAYADSWIGSHFPIVVIDASVFLSLRWVGEGWLPLKTEWDSKMNTAPTMLWAWEALLGTGPRLRLHSPLSPPWFSR